MSRKMVVVPYELAKQIIEPLMGDSGFDLKDGADLETTNRLNRALNRQDGEKEDDDDKSKKKKLVIDDEPTIPSTPDTPTPETPRRPPARRIPPPRSRPTRAQLRMKLLKSGAFDSRSKAVMTWEGKQVTDSDIDTILSHAFGSNSESHPTGSREVAARLKVMSISNLPNREFNRLIAGYTSPSTPRLNRWRKM